MWATDMKYQAENWINTSKLYNSLLDDEEDNINCNELNKYCLNRSIKIPESKTFPQLMYNLPDDKRLINKLLDYENKKVEYIPWQIIEIFRDMPFKWISKVSSHFCGNDKDVIIIEDVNELPQTIQKYISKFYAKYYRTAGFGYNIYPKQCGAVSMEVGLEYFLIDTKLSKRQFSRCDNVNYYVGDECAYLFDGITIENFYLLYFKSGLSKEFIFRFLRNNEFAYLVDHQAIEKQVEEILSKH